MGRGRGSKFKMCQDNRSPVAQAQNKANKVSQITNTVNGTSILHWYEQLGSI